MATQPKLDYESLDDLAMAGRLAARDEAAVRTLIAATGDDPAREGLRDTPARVARAYREWFAGYPIDPARLLDRVFDADDYDDIVLLRAIPLVSTC